MKVIYDGVEVRAELSVMDVQNIYSEYEVYIADGNLIINDKGYFNE